MDTSMESRPDPEPPPRPPKPPPDAATDADYARRNAPGSPRRKHLIGRWLSGLAARFPSRGPTSSE
jgi:hypothetical protein